MKDLADSIGEKLQEQLFVGAELHWKKDDGVHPCKILKVIQKGVDTVSYEVAWLDKNKNIREQAEVSAEDLVHKKPLFSRNIFLASFLLYLFSTTLSTLYIIYYPFLFSSI